MELSVLSQVEAKRCLSSVTPAIFTNSKYESRIWMLKLNLGKLLKMEMVVLTVDQKSSFMLFTPLVVNPSIKWLLIGG